MADALHSDGSTRCDWCGDDCGNDDGCNALSCTYGPCEGGIYHQECLYQFLRANKLEKNRKTGFKCPRGCGKGTRFPTPCPGRIDKSHPYIPRNEEKFKKRQAVAAELPPKPPKPDKAAEKLAARQKAEEERAAAAKAREDAAKAKHNGPANQPVSARALASQLGAKPSKPDKGIDMQQAAILKAAALRELKGGGGGAALTNGTPGRGDRAEPSGPPAAHRISGPGVSPGGSAVWGTRAAGNGGASVAAGASADAEAAVPTATTFTLGQLLQVASRKAPSKATSNAAVALLQATTPHHNHTGSGGSASSSGAGGQEPPEISSHDEFPPVAAPPPPPPPVGKPPPSPWIALSAVPTQPMAVPQQRHRLSDSSQGGGTPTAAPSQLAGGPFQAAQASSVASSSVAVDGGLGDGEDDEDAQDGTGAGGKGLSKAQRKNLKRAEKKKRQGSMTVLDVEASASDVASLHSEADAPAGGVVAAGVGAAGTAAAPPPAPLRTMIVPAESPAGPPLSQLLQQAANADHLLDDQNSPPAPSHNAVPHRDQQQQQQQQRLSDDQPVHMHQAPPPPQPQQHQQQQQAPPGYDAFMQDAAGDEGDVLPSGPPPQQQQQSQPDLPHPPGVRDTFLEDLCIKSLVTYKCNLLFTQLRRLGFSTDQALSAVQVCGSTAERALPWLLERLHCGPQQLSAVVACAPQPDVDISGELQMLGGGQVWLQLPPDVLYRATIDCSGDVRAALAALQATYLAPLSQQSTSPPLQPAHSLETFYSAQSELPLSRAHTGRSDFAWPPDEGSGGGGLGDAIMAARRSLRGDVTPAQQGYEKQLQREEMWQGGLGGGGRWSIDGAPFAGQQGQLFPRPSMDEMLAGGPQQNGDMYARQHMANGHSMWGEGGGNGNGAAVGVHGSTGAAWESHGSAGDPRPQQGGAGRAHSSSQVDESEVSALMALMCR